MAIIPSRLPFLYRALKKSKPWPDIGGVKVDERFMFVSDLQIPFEATSALKFCRAVQKEFRIPPDHVYCVGDEVDQYFGSLYKKDPDGWYTAASELAATRDKLRAWYKAFPEMKLAISNHGLRWAKKAWEAEIPSQMLRPYQELIEAPTGWVWRPEWRIKTRHPLRMIHGCGYSGQLGARNAALDSGLSTVIGHLHSFGGVWPIRTGGQKYWAMNTGALIDEDAYAFHYSKYARNRPTLGLGVVVDSGLTPIFLPLERMP